MLLALTDQGRPGYDAAMASQVAALGIPVFACTPDLFPDLMAKTTVRWVTLASAEDIELWRWHQDFLARERDQQQGN